MDIKVMEPVALPDVAAGDFIHQIKWDGIRGVSVIQNGAVSVYTKNGNDVTAAYPELRALTDRMDARQAVLDGEIVVFADGKPSFYHALKRSRGNAAYPARYVVFDLLMLNGKDLRGDSIERRQALLRSRFSGCASMALADGFDDGEALFALMKKRNMEGIVSKRRGSVYTAGKSHSDWFKTKVLKKMLCAVTGVHFSEGQAASLSLGVYRGGTLESVGHASLGLTQDDLRVLAEYARREGERTGRNDIRVEPRLTCWVKFLEWTPQMTLRHPVLLGFADKAPAEAQGEEFSV